ncbi:unnamed protein product [Arctia plantaginis]|uniref:Major facilitator superfamily (MFS) profile domain-containing protein n=1 Tax=Arctia plantaginis TaxID=874455 RepID=A0A8S1AL92_ARCPL|nr:unnamed protein product [Arctia plantaginis]
MGGEKINLDNGNDTTEKLNQEPEEDHIIIDKVLFHLGHMGLYQKLLFIGMFPFGCYMTFVYLVQIFITVTPNNHWCRIPELANLSMELRRNLSAPITASGDFDRCMTFDANWTQVLQTLQPPPPDSPLVPCRNGWEFELSDIPYHTVSTEREWVCDRASYVPLAQSLYFVGSVVGGLLFGWMADRFGRVPALVGSNLIGGIGGVATIFTTGLADFIFCRFLVGMAYDNCFMIMYILVLEYVDPEDRTMVASLSLALFYGTSVTLLPWIAYFIADWRILLWVTSLPLFLVLVAPWLIPESTRWLVSRGKVNDAIKVLRRFERVNNVKIPNELMAEFIITSNNKRLEERQSFLNVFKSGPLRLATVCLLVAYTGCNMVFDGLVRLSGSFGLDFFLTFSLNSGTEIPALILLVFILDRWGRRNLTCGSLMMSGLFLVIAMFVQKGIGQAALVIFSRFFINMAITTVTQWNTEIFPTPFRASGSAVLHLCAFFATMLTPFIVYSERVWGLLPLLIFAAIVVVTAGVSLSLPETKGLQLPQSVADGEKIIVEHSLCGKPEDGEEGPYQTDVTKRHLNDNV